VLTVSLQSKPTTSVLYNGKHDQ